MTPEKIVFARPFCLHRHHDVSGVSGDGIVAHGVEFPDGTVALRWVGSNPTSVVFHDNGIESVEAIHGHGGNTEVVWVAGVQMSRAVKAEAEANDRDHKWLDFHHAAWEADLRERIAQEIEAAHRTAPDRAVIAEAAIARVRAVCDAEWDWKAGRSLHAALRAALDGEA